MKNLIITVILVVVVFFLYLLIFKQDRWLGFYYPDRSDLSNYKVSNEEFKSFEECKNWVRYISSGKLDTNYDYECGKNCRMDNYGMYICDETRD